MNVKTVNGTLTVKVIIRLNNPTVSVRLVGYGTRTLWITRYSGTIGDGR
ncbi:MAG: hypothetical protein LBG52_04865 [Candidatus Peribacteria bacterium]|nr:hypothetical protein [Candidatus Peribacteria bacterium]